MAYSVKYTGESHQLGDSAKHFVTVYADTAADMPAPDPAWAAGSELIVMEDGGAKYRLNNAGEWVESSFDAGGGGAGEGSAIPEFVVLEESGRIQLGRSLSGQNVGFPIVGHDAFYQAYGYGTIMRIPFDTGAQTQFPAVCAENPQCWITHMAYGNGLYFGVDTVNGKAYRSEDAVNWEMFFDFQIDAMTVTSIWYANKNFFFACGDGRIGAALCTEDYHRVVDYTNMYGEVVDAGALRAVYDHFGADFFVTDTGIVSGYLGGGEFRRLAFLEEAPEDPYIATTLAFWSNHLVMFNEIEQLIYIMPMRYPHDTGGNFIDPEWRFYYADDWRNELNPLGVSVYGGNLLVYTDRNIYCIDSNGIISKMNTEDLGISGVQCVVTTDKTILVCDGTRAYQFFIK